MTGPNGPAEAVTEQLRLALPEEFSLDLPARGPVRFVVERDRRRRTRVGIVIDPAGFVRMDAPTNAELEEIREIAREHARWISRRLSQLGELGTYYVSPGFETGELHHYLGSHYALVLLRHHDEPDDSRFHSRRARPGPFDHFLDALHDGGGEALRSGCVDL